MSDYYELLGVKRIATVLDIKNAFRKQLQQWHPDRNSSPIAAEKTRALIAAWEILKDPQKRAAYDAALVSPEDVLASPLRNWQHQARSYAEEEAKKSFQEILKDVGIKTVWWFFSASVGISFCLLFVGSILWITQLFGGWDAPYAGFVYWGSFLILYPGMFAAGYFIQKLAALQQCNKCGKKVEVYMKCCKCGMEGCFACIGVLIVDCKRGPLWACQKCGEELGLVENPSLFAKIIRNC